MVGGPGSRCARSGKLREMGFYGVEQWRQFVASPYICVGVTTVAKYRAVIGNELRVGGSGAVLMALLGVTESGFRGTYQNEQPSSSPAAADGGARGSSADGGGGGGRTPGGTVLAARVELVHGLRMAATSPFSACSGVGEADAEATSAPTARAHQHRIR
uniref:Uncharacterized protein n=1 Tax=Oryza nivara TaxID=4536 RepID=A0A0E0HBJ6_ORYNI